MLSRQVVCGTLVWLLAVGSVGLAQRARPRAAKGLVCGDPTAACRTTYEFQPYDLPFRIPPRAVIWESEPFYAVVLKSVRAPNDACDMFVPEAERQQAQALWPHNKVFTSRCAEPGTLYYTGTSGHVQFMAVYAGRTRPEAARLLAQVRATERFAGAYLRRMSTGFNGT